MAMQTGIGVSKILILAGAGYTGTILLKNGKLSDLLAELHLLLKSLEKRGDQSDSECEKSDDIASQVGRLAYEIRQLTLNRPILNGCYGQTAPAAALSALGYGYIWWKGLSFSSLMYVTKRSMEKAVSDLTKKLLHASDVIADAKKHLTQRIQHLDDKMLKQNELARSIKDEVTGVRNTITDFHEDLVNFQQAVGTLDARLSSLSWEQDYANRGLEYLIGVVHGKSGQMLEFVQKQLKLPGKSPGLLTYGESPSLKGLKDIAGTLSTGLEQSASDIIMKKSMDKLEQHQRPMLRLLQSVIDDKVFSR